MEHQGKENQTMYTNSGSVPDNVTSFFANVIVVLFVVFKSIKKLITGE